ncbi:MAG: metallophosphoesterase [Syntrophales bacterium]
MFMLKLLFFAILGVALLVGSHYFLYRSLVGLFSLTNPWLKDGLLIIFAFLSTSFVIASIVAHKSQAPFSRFFYLGAAAWLGLAVNLVIAVCLIRLTAHLVALANCSVSLSHLSIGVFILALLFSAYGFHNAFHPQIKIIDVSLKNLPTAWKGKKIVQLSDIHLGHIHGTASLQDLVTQTNAQDPDLILITGDLFDGTDGNLNDFIQPLNSLRANKGIFFVTGNHETYLGLDKTFAVLNQTPIKVLNNETVDIDGLQIVGISYPIRGEAGSSGKLPNYGSYISAFRDLDRTKPGILMHHAPTSLDQAQAAGIALQLSGHTHKGQIWPFSLITWLIYGKYHYGLHARGDFQIYTTNGACTWGPPMRTGNTPEIPVFRLQ